MARRLHFGAAFFPGTKVGHDVAHRRLTVLSFLGLSWAGACSQGEVMDMPKSLGGGAFTGTGGTGFQGGGGSGNTTGVPPSEQESDTYTAPVVSGKWIWTANPLSGKVALIDAETLRVATADAGLAPTYVAGLEAGDGEDSAAIVLNVGNDTASVLHATDGVIGVETVAVHAGANRMTVSKSGRWAVVWSDASLVPSADPTEGLQDVTVVDLASSPPVPYPLTVGYRPSRVTIGAGEAHAYFVTEPGVSVVDLPKADPPSISRDIPVTSDPTEAASVRDVTVTPDGSFAIVRREGKPTVSVVSLGDASAIDVTLAGPVTDLDLAPDGKTAFAVVRASAPMGTAGAGGSAGTGGSGTGGTPATAGSSSEAGSGNGGMAGAEGGAPALGGEGGEPSAGGQAGAEGGAPAGAGAPSAGETSSEGGMGALPATGGTGNAGTGGTSASGGSAGQSQTPATSFVAALPLAAVLDDPTAFTQVAIEDTLGSIAIAEQGSIAVLYTNATNSDHAVILDTSKLEVVRTVVVQSPIQTVLVAPDGENAVALLRQAANSQKAGGFSLIPLSSKLPPKLVGTDAPPQSVALGDRQALITVEGTNPTTQAKVHAVYRAELPGFGTTKITLASPPISAALIPEVDRGVVAQAHPEGRITFIELESGQPHTITGFELSSRVVQDD
jgi:hypothetical protein